MNKFSPRRWRVTKKSVAFTLVELLVAAAIFLILLALLLTIVSHITQIWQGTEAQRFRQQAMRLVLDRISRDLEGILLPREITDNNSLQLLINPGTIAGIENPNAAFWQTSVAGDTSRGDLAEVGYFVRFVSNAKPIRGELCRIEVPATATNSIFSQAQNWLTSEKVNTYAPTSGVNSTDLLKGVLADQVIGLWITPYAGTTKLPVPYDSRTAVRFPDSVEVALAIIDPRTANRVTSPTQITSHYTSAPEDFVNALDEDLRSGVTILKTRISLPNTR